MAKKINIDVLLFLCFLFLGFNYLFFLGLRVIEPGFLNNIVRVAVIAICILFFYLKKCDTRWIVFSISLIFFMFIINENKFVANLIFMFLFSCVVRHSNTENLLKYLYFVSLILVFVHFLLCYFGITSADAVMMYQVGERVRFTFGFANPNALAVFYASLFYTAYYYYLLVNQKFTAFSFFIFIVAFTVMYLSGSRTIFYLSCVFLLVSFLPKRMYFNRFFRFVVIMLPFMCSILTIFISLQYHSHLNEVLSLRPLLFYNALSKFDEFTILFGLAFSEDDLVDNSYILIISACGLVLYMVFLIFLSYRIAVIKAEYLPFVTFVLTTSIFESFLIRPEFTITLLFIVCLFSRPQSVTNKTSMSV